VNERGFTILETAAVCVIAGILLASTLPGFLQYRSTMRRTQAREQVMQDVRAARQIAVTRRTPVIMAFGDGTVTNDVLTYTVHVDTNADRIYQSTESRKSFTLPPETRLYRVQLTPTDSLFFDISGVLYPGTLGGSLIVASQSTTDTLLVSGAGMVYRQ
jgi:type II secretory pathway pseudopilin PulG